MTQTSGTPTYQLAQAWTVMPLKAGKAYTIPCDEWDLLKSRIEELTDEPWFFQSLGTLLWGIALSTPITMMIGTFTNDQLTRGWAASAVAAIGGTLSFIFGLAQRRIERRLARDVTTQMDLIENRFERP